MPALPLAGPSYSLRSANADSQRTIGWMPVLIESNTGKGGQTAYLKQQPGLRLLASGLGGKVRGLKFANGLLFAVVGNTLKEISSTWTATDRGTIADGDISMVENNTQLCIVSAPSYAYVHDFDTHNTALLGNNWRGSVSVDVLDGFGVFSEPDTNQFYLTANQDFSTLDALQFASAEGGSGNVIGFIAKHGELIFLKEARGEVWYDSGGSDFPLSRNDGARLEVGLLASATLKKLGGIAYWLGRDEAGSAMVFALQGYTPQRISSHALEELLGAVDDLSGAKAFAYSQEGLSFYVLQVPGLETTWVYEVASGIWHERAEWVNGEYAPWRVTCHAYAYGVHVVGDANGNLYELDPLKNTNNGDVLIRDRITPHNAASTLNFKRFGSIQVDCDVGSGLPSGSAAQMMLRYSNDGGRTWSNWRYLSLGAIGMTKARARASRLGTARDRVWHIRVTDDVACNVIAAVVDEK